MKKDDYGVASYYVSDKEFQIRLCKKFEIYFKKILDPKYYDDSKK